MLFLRLFLASAVTLTATQAFAWGCPPWLPCGKYHNIIIPDFDGYGAAVSGAADAAAVVLTPEPTGPSQESLDVNSAERQLEQQLVRAQAISDQQSQRLDEVQRSRIQGNQFWVLDLSSPRQP